MDEANELPRRVEADLSHLPNDEQHLHRAIYLSLLGRPEIRDRLIEHGELNPGDVRALWLHAADVWAELTGRDGSEFVKEDQFYGGVPLFNLNLWLCERFPDGHGHSDPVNYPPTPEGETQRLTMISLMDQFMGGAEGMRRRWRRRGYLK